MKILQITPFFYPSLAGMETYVLNLSKNLALEGHKVDILTINTENASENENLFPNVNVIRSPISFRYNKGLLSLNFVKDILNRKNYDVYHIHMPFAFGLEIAILASKINKIPLIATHHGEGTFNNVFYNFLSRSYSAFSRYGSFNLLNSIIFLTESYYESIELSRFAKNKIKIVRTGADVKRFSPINSDSGLRKKYGIVEDDKVLLFVASLSKNNHYKGLDYLIKAMSQLSDHKLSLKLVVVGDGELLSHYKKLSDKYGILNNVIFSGSIPNEDIEPYYAMSDFFVLPSISGPENSPMVIFEAIASGKPVIASDIPGVSSIINDSFGIKVRPKSYADLANAIQKLAINDDLRKNMGKNARKVAENYSWEACVKEMEKIYQEVKK